MTINNQGLPIHNNATFAIRPRIFLEGNFFVDVIAGHAERAGRRQPGTSFPIQQGIEPVQLDQVLTGLQPGHAPATCRSCCSSTARRSSRRALVQPLDPVLAARPTSTRRSSPTTRSGIQPHDLSNYIAAQGSTAGALDAHPQNLQNLITDFNTTANAFARQNTALQQTLVQLPRTLAAAIPALQRAQRRLLQRASVPNCAASPVPQFARPCCRASSRPARRSTPACRSSTSCACWCSRRSCAGWRRTSSRPSRRWPG